MNLFSNLRLSVGRHILHKKSSQLDRQRMVHNFETASSACILFECTKEDDLDTIRNFKSFLESHKVTTTIIGFVNDKEIPSHFILRQGFNCFCTRQLNWWYIPSVPFINVFLDTQYDLLFDLTLEYLFPVHYLLRLSGSHYKIGRFSDPEEYDLMIDISKQNNLDYFCRQIRHYLGMIKSSRMIVPERPG